MKAKPALIIIMLIATLFGTGCLAPYVYVVGQAGNYESKSTDYKVKPPVGFRTTLKNLETKYRDEWTAFDKNTDNCTVYYGWLRGNVRGEYKLKVRHDLEKDSVNVEFIALNRHGVGGMGISGYKDAGKTGNKDISKYNWIMLPLDIKDLVVAPKATYFKSEKDKTAFLSHDSIKVPLRGGDLWGPFTVKVEAKVLNQGKIMEGTWDTNHGFFGDYKGTLYGVRLGPDEKDSASIANEDLYQAMMNFDPEKK
tara:strand:+ start:13 stop:768 length:756 start_codon:yes stop_codon:yes gene_type:complete